MKHTPCCVSLPLLISTLFLLSSVAFAEDSTFRSLINCKEYTSATDSVAVFEGPSDTTDVLGRLETGERVCVIGERAEFFIIDWKRHDAYNHRHVNSVVEPATGYVQKSDILEVTDIDDDLYSRAKRQMNRMNEGLIPEDVYGPLRPVIDLLQPPTECLAGETICARVKELETQRAQRECIDAEGTTAGALAEDSTGLCSKEDKAGGEDVQTEDAQ